MEGGQRGVEREKREIGRERERERKRDRPGRLTERKPRKREKIVEDALERKKRKGAI